MEKKRKPRNYVDNEKLLAAMIEYKKQVEDAKAAGKERPQIPAYIGKCIYDISTQRASTANFRNYPFVEEMISDGYENVIRYIDNFDPVKYKKPFAYFTMIIWRAFIRRIEDEKSLLEAKIKYESNYYVFDEFGEFAQESKHGFGNDQYVKEFLAKREETRKKKNDRSKQNSTKHNSIDSGKLVKRDKKSKVNRLCKKSVS